MSHGSTKGVPIDTDGTLAGTVSSVAMNTASLIFGIGYSNTTGTAVIQTSGVIARCYHMT